MKSVKQRARFTKMWAGLAALGLIASLSACNADEATAGDDGAPQGADTVEAAGKVVDGISKDDALAAKLPDKYKESANVSMTFTFPPMRYREGDKELGAEYELARAVTKKLGIEMKVQEVAFDGVIPALKANRVDFAVASYADLPDRRKEVSFVDYYRSATALEVKKGNPLGVKSLSDMCGHSLALQTGIESVETAKSESKKCETDGKKPIDVKLYESSNDATLAVVNGRADATGNDYPAAVHEAKSVGGGNALEVSEGRISSDYYYGIVTRKDDTELQETLKETLQSLMDGGEYGTIFKAYGLSEGMIEKSGINDGPAKD